MLIGPPQRYTPCQQDPFPFSKSPLSCKELLFFHAAFSHFRIAIGPAEPFPLPAVVPLFSSQFPALTVGPLPELPWLRFPLPSAKNRSGLSGQSPALALPYHRYAHRSVQDILTPLGKGRPA